MPQLYRDYAYRTPTAARTAICYGLLICSGLMGGSRPAKAETAACPMQLQKAADRGVAKINNWIDLYMAFSRYRSCDDGAVAEGFSDRITTLLATRWDTLPQLGKLLTEHRELRGFVLSHIDETADPTNLQLIVANVDRYGCRGVTKETCTDIRKDAKDALAILSQ